MKARLDAVRASCAELRDRSSGCGFHDARRPARNRRLKCQLGQHSCLDKLRLRERRRDPKQRLRRKYWCPFVDRPDFPGKPKAGKILLKKVSWSGPQIWKALEILDLAIVETQLLQIIEYLLQSRGNQE